jgi:hypothetical protein
MKRQAAIIAVLAAITPLLARAQGTSQPTPTEAVVEEAYIYGFPIIVAYKALYQSNVDQSSGQYKAPFNQIWNDGHVFTPQDTAITTPNSDTPYSMVQADLRVEPIVLRVPQVDKGRYYSVQLLDIYSFNYGYIGTRTTGNGPGCYMVAGPDWKGETPDAVKATFHSETRFSLIIYRTQLFNPADMVNVRKIQAGYKVQTLSAFLSRPAPPPAPAIDWPKFTPQAFTTEFPAVLNFLLQFCPEVPQERALRARLAGIGIAPGRKLDPRALTPEQKAEFVVGIRSAFGNIETAADNIGKKITGWGVGAAAGNRAFFDGDYLLRAAGAKAGIYGADADEAIYPYTREDGSGQPLDGSANRYMLTFAPAQLPPVNAFWSVTMYDGKTQLLIENPINRYLVNSPMLPGMRKNADGSLTIYIQKDSRGKDKESNWLPTPNGRMFLVMRLYLPKQTPPSILPPGEGTWNPPPILPNT